MPNLHVLRRYKARTMRKTPKNDVFSSKKFFTQKLLKMMVFRGYKARTMRKTPKNVQNDGY